jgi:hypothetical protein
MSAGSRLSGGKLTNRVHFELRGVGPVTARGMQRKVPCWRKLAPQGLAPQLMPDAKGRQGLMPQDSERQKTRADVIGNAEVPETVWVV